MIPVIVDICICLCLRTRLALAHVVSERQARVIRLCVNVNVRLCHFLKLSAFCGLWITLAVHTRENSSLQNREDAIRVQELPSDTSPVTSLLTPSHSQVTSEAALPERQTACCGEREVFTRQVQERRHTLWSTNHETSKTEPKPNHSRIRDGDGDGVAVPV